MEHSELSELISDGNIIIKSADKGGAAVGTLQDYDYGTS